MATITQATIISILKTGTYPTSQRALQYYQQKQKFPIYPFVEVRKVQSDSNTTDIESTSKDQTFEINFYMKWTRPEAIEEADRLATENEMLRVLENYDFLPTGKIFFESKSWNTSIIDDAIYGSKSTLRFTIKEVTSTSGVGYIGAGDKLELNSQTTPIQIQILAMNTKKGFSIDTHHTDDGKSVYDPFKIIEFGEYVITYTSTPAIDAVIDALSASAATNNGKLIRGATETKLTFYVGQSNKSGQYGSPERVTTPFYAVGTWV